MESTIKWQTGEPKETGTYIVSIMNDIGETGTIVLIWNSKDREFLHMSMHPELQVVAWCNMEDIEPFDYINSK